MIRRIGAVLALLALAFGGLTVGAPGALAADNVVEAQTVAATSGGDVLVKMRFDNTNCNADSTVNCSGANGAQLIWIDVTVPSGSDITFTSGDAAGNFLQNVYIDVWGDDTSCTGQSLSPDFARISSKHIHWDAYSNLTHVRRVKINGAAHEGPYGRTYTSKWLNPFGYSTANC